MRTALPMWRIWWPPRFDFGGSAMQPVCLIFTGLVLATPAHADLVFCNETGVKASVAIGYVEDGVWTSEGWWGVAPFDCTPVVTDTLKKRYYYWRATNTHGAFDTGNYGFCTRSKAFTIAGDHDCEGRGFRREKFAEIDTGEAVSHIVALTEAMAPAGTSDEEGPAHMMQGFLAPPGTHGEPYSIRASFESCSYQGNDLLCSFLADGWRYVASSADPTDPHFFGDFQYLQSGTLVDLSGDMIFYADDIAQITIREWGEAVSPSVAPPGSLEGLHEFLQGFWISDDDSAYAWSIQDNELQEFYDANLMQRSYFELAPSCAASNGQGPVIIAWPDPDEGDGPTCYLVLHTDPNSLGLANVVVGRDLSFTYAN
jgi:uncharacterized membrane protein